MRLEERAFFDARCSCFCAALRGVVSTGKLHAMVAYSMYLLIRAMRMINHFFFFFVFAA